MHVTTRAGFVAVLFALAANSAAQQLEKPFRVQAGGAPIDVDGGHAAPFVADVDGDGVRDLLVGQFQKGRCRFYKNLGTDAVPRFGEFTFVEAGGRIAEVAAMGSVGFGPQMADLDGDGHADLISGSYSPGDVSVFFGESNGVFAKGEFLKGPAGRNANAGQRWPSPTKPDHDSLASAPCLADWDGDGDLDLLVGNSVGYVVLLTNEGGAKAPQFVRTGRVQAAGVDLNVDGANAGPTTADWDGDGRWDLIVGGAAGNVMFFRNEGEAGAPRFAAGVLLVKGTGGDDERPAGVEPSGPHARSKPHVTDWNGDGALDLLVGDFASLVGPEPVLTAEQRATKSRIEEQRAELGKVIDALYDKCNWDITKLKSDDREAMKDAADRSGALGRQLQTLRAQSRSAGFVWVFLRKK